MSRLVLIFHSLLFWGLVIVCVASPIIAALYPGPFRQYSLFVFGGIGVLILIVWWAYGGVCPLTVWENYYRKIEGRETYAGACIDQYAKRWFGLTLPHRFSDIFPIAILLIPLVTRFFV